jgi:hypothetical protein
MKKVLILIFSVSLVVSLQAQISFEYRLGYGTYQMKSVTKFQNYILEESGLPGQIVNQFPGYINHKIYLGLPSKWPQYKMYLGYVTTGGRISLADYSGKWNFDMLLNGFQLGLHWESPHKMLKKIEMSAYLDFGTTISVLNLIDNMEVWDEQTEQSQQFFANSLDGEAGIQAFYKLLFFGFGCYLGYEQDVSIPFYLDGDYQTKLGISDSNLTHPGWAGLRCGISMTYSFGRKNKQKNKD